MAVGATVCLRVVCQRSPSVMNTGMWDSTASGAGLRRIMVWRGAVLHYHIAKSDLSERKASRPSQTARFVPPEAVTPSRKGLIRTCQQIDQTFEADAQAFYLLLNAPCS